MTKADLAAAAIVQMAWIAQLAVALPAHTPLNLPRLADDWDYIEFMEARVRRIRS